MNLVHFNILKTAAHTVDLEAVENRSVTDNSTIAMLTTHVGNANRRPRFSHRAIWSRRVQQERGAKFQEATS